YVYRVLLTSIHLMRTGRVEANLLRLNEEFKLPYVDELVHQKQKGTEKETLNGADLAFHQAEYNRLCAELEEAYLQSKLPDVPSCEEQLDALLVRVRLDFGARNSE